MNKPKKILILAYFFPPCNLTGSYRAHSFAKYLHLFGYYPIVITRKWDHQISELRDMSTPIYGEVIIEKFGTYEVHRLPYIGNLRDRIYNKFGDKRFVIFRKLLTLWEIVLKNFFKGVVPFSNLHSYASNILRANTDIKVIITSGLPYILFRFCYLLNKKHKVPWIADYRDEWTSNEWNTDYNKVQKLINRLERYSEKKWLNTAVFCTTVSNLWASRLQHFLGIPSFTVYNGYDEDDYNFNTPIIPFKDFTIVYNGSLYYRQEVEIFLEGFKSIVNEYKNIYFVKLLFLGLGFDADSTKRIQVALEGYENNYEITGRIAKDEVIEIQMCSQLFLLIPPRNIAGCTTSKIFEYFACKKNILLCPGDNDIEDELIRKTQTGFIANSNIEVADILRKLIIEYFQTGRNVYLSNEVEVEKYSRKNQTKILASIIDQYIS